MVSCKFSLKPIHWVKSWWFSGCSTAFGALNHHPSSVQRGAAVFAPWYAPPWWDPSGIPGEWGEYGFPKKHRRKSWDGDWKWTTVNHSSSVVRRVLVFDPRCEKTSWFSQHRPSRSRKDRQGGGCWVRFHSRNKSANLRGHTVDGCEILHQLVQSGAPVR